MATNVRGRTGTRSRTTSGSYNYTSKGWGRTTTPKGSYMTKKWNKGNVTQNIPPAWKTCASTLEWKLNSYRTLYNQTKGPARYTRPSPTTINSFANWVGKGGIIHTVTPAQVARWAKTTRKTFNTRTPTPTACKSVLWAKFGKNTIKAVARTKTGSFMVVTPQVINGKNFWFPK